MHVCVPIRKTYNVQMLLQALLFLSFFTDSYAPFQSMSVRESFLTVNESLAAAPGPGHYSVDTGSGFGSDRGRGALHNKVSISVHQHLIFMYDQCIHLPL